ncbi:hypothetical protein B0H14DRAFT_2629002 [Mycena olivaceomarginata]|nr:hypothetical protein B0H14DRAFT_2629002 [Mycena olivaceomarginata]
MTDAQNTPAGLQRHSTLYWPDGTCTLKAADGTYFNVNRQLLILKSDCFSGMLSLPIAGHPPLKLTESTKQLIEQARTARLDGTSDATAVPLPAQFTAAECQVFLEFIFNVLPWTKDPPALERLFESGMQYTTHHLEDHPDLGPALRYRLASCYDITHWAKPSVLRRGAPHKTVSDWGLQRSLTMIANPIVVFLLICKASPRHCGTLACDPGEGPVVTLRRAHVTWRGGQMYGCLAGEGYILGITPYTLASS